MPGNNENMENYNDGLDEVFALDEDDKEALDSIKYLWDLEGFSKQGIFKYIQQYSFETVYKLYRQDAFFREVCSYPELSEHWLNSANKFLSKTLLQLDANTLKRLNLSTLDLIERCGIFAAYQTERRNKAKSLNHPAILRLIEKIFSYEVPDLLLLWINFERYNLIHLDHAKKNLINELRVYLEYLNRYLLRMLQCDHKNNDVPPCGHDLGYDHHKECLYAAYAFSDIGGCLHNAGYKDIAYQFYQQAMMSVCVAEHVYNNARYNSPTEESKAYFLKIKDEVKNRYKLEPIHERRADEEAKEIVKISCSPPASPQKK